MRGLCGREPWCAKVTAASTRVAPRSGYAATAAWRACPAASNSVSRSPRLHPSPSRASFLFGRAASNLDRELRESMVTETRRVRHLGLTARCHVTYRTITRRPSPPVTFAVTCMQGCIIQSAASEQLARIAPARARGSPDRSILAELCDNRSAATMAGGSPGAQRVRFGAWKPACEEKRWLACCWRALRLVLRGDGDTVRQERCVIAPSRTSSHRLPHWPSTAAPRRARDHRGSKLVCSGRRSRLYAEVSIDLLTFTNEADLAPANYLPALTRWPQACRAPRG